MVRDRSSNEPPRSRVDPLASKEHMNDERWLADFANDLGCFSLSSDEAESEGRRHHDEMGLDTMTTEEQDSEHLHHPVGI